MKKISIIITIIFILSCQSQVKEKINQEDSIRTEKETTTSGDREIETEEEEEITEQETIEEEAKPDIDYDEKAYCKKCENITYGTGEYEKGSAIKFYFEKDLPTASDPEGVSKLWKKRYDYIKEKVSDCYCTIYDNCKYPNEPLLKPLAHNVVGTFYSRKDLITSKDYDKVITIKPDFALNDWIWGWEKPWDASNGKIIMTLLTSGGKGYFNLSYGFLYDIKSKRLLNLGIGFHGAEHAVGKRYVLFRPGRLDIDGREGWHYANIAYYDMEKNRYGFAFKEKGKLKKVYGVYDTKINDKYAVIGIMDRAPKYEDEWVKIKHYYTKVGDWNNWKRLSKYATPDPENVDEKVGMPKLVGSKLVYFNYGVEVVYCDLDKGNDSCVLVTQKGENGRYPLLSSDGKKVYYDRELNYKEEELVEADLTDPHHIKYKTIKNIDNLVSLEDINTRFLIYEKKIGMDKGPSGKGEAHNKFELCYYRFSDKKHICLDSEQDKKLNYIYAAISGKYLIYQEWYDLVIRDMEKYCKVNKSQCPYEEYLK